VTVNQLLIVFIQIHQNRHSTLQFIIIQLSHVS